VSKQPNDEEAFEAEPANDRTPFLIAYVFALVYIKDLAFEVGNITPGVTTSSVITIVMWVVALPLFGVIFAAFAVSENNPWVRAGFFGLLSAMSLTFLQSLFVFSQSLRMTALMVNVLLGVYCVLVLHWDRWRSARTRAA